MMQQHYGETCPDFLETSWQDAAVQAHRQYKFLFVYLHSPDHEVGHDFTDMLPLSILVQCKVMVAFMYELQC